MTASTFHSAFASGSVPSMRGAERGFVTGGVRLLLRLEGFAAFAAALAAYWHNDFSWLAFALFFLTPDFAMLAYLAGPRAGAFGYNFAHTYVLPLAIALFGLFGGVPFAAAGGLIWIAHIGVDRALGYGLKYPTAFGDTHLGGVGRP
jgi:Domain of unknown function (DUF4260)